MPLPHTQPAITEELWFSGCGADQSHRDESATKRGGVKRGNLYAEQGGIGDECLSGALSVSGKLLES